MASTDNIKVEIKPTLEQVQARLAKKREAVTNLRTPMARAAILLDQWVQKNFRSEGGKVGSWEPFAKNKNGIPFVEAKNPGRAPAKLLQDTGRLRSSFSPFATSKTAGIGSDLPYAKYHHEGTGRLPMRQLLPDKGSALKEVKQAAKEVLSDYVNEAIKK